tara:strand:+ start:1906 stop:2397 length:492 start_codon:yes stop_codon:yes gene_type:complete
MEWTGLKVCTDGCWEAEHPQLTQGPIRDPIALHRPRPGNHSREDVKIRIKGVQGFVLSSDGAYLFTTTDENNTAAGQESVTAVGFFTFGVQTTSALGTVAHTIAVLPSGLASVASVGSFGIVVDDTYIIASGVASIMSLGTPTVTITETFWGSGGWGQNTWGD